MEFSVTIDSRIEGTTAAVSGEGFEPSSRVSIAMFSDPIDLGAALVGADGTFSKTVTIPPGVEPGSHKVVVSGKSFEAEAVDYTWYLQLNAEREVVILETEPLDTPPEWYVPDELGFAVVGDTLLPEYIVTEHAAAAVATMVSAFALFSMFTGPAPSFAGGSSGFGFGGSSGLGIGGFSGGPGGSSGGGVGGGAGGLGAAGAGAGAAAAQPGTNKKRKLGKSGVAHASVELEGEAIGDRSDTWRFKYGGTAVDAFSTEAPPMVSPRSPFVARLLADPIYLRAMFGSLSLLMPVLGLVFGALAALSVGGDPVPPALGLLLLIVAVGTADALAGFVATVAFVLITVLSGNVTSADNLRGLLGLCLLFFIVPVIASKARPLRRPASTTNAEHFDRFADVVIASLIGAWAAKKLVGALPALSGLDLPIADQSGTVALLVLMILIVRMFAETLVVWWYPQRLVAVTPADIPSPGLTQKTVSIFLQAALLWFVAIAYLGNVWELYAGVAMIAVPQLIGLHKDRLPNAPWLVRMLPAGITKTTAMIVVGTLFAALVASRIDDPARYIRLGFVVLGLPGLFLTFVGWFGRSGDKWELNWIYRIAGIGVLILGVLLAEKVISI